MSEVPLPWDQSDTDINDYISTYLRPDEDVARNLDVALDNLMITHLRDAVTYTISRIRRGGGLAQRIHLKEDELDFELYVFIGDLRGIDEHRQRIDKILIETRDVLDNPDLMHLVMVRGEEKEMIKEGRISIRVTADDEWFEGKLYPTVDLLGVKPSNATLEIMYRQYTRDADKACFLPALRVLYINLIQSLPQNVRDLILLLKYWEKSKLQLRGRKLPDRFWEVICIRRWEMAGSPKTFNCARGLFDVLELVSDWRAIMITWETSEHRFYSKKIADEKRREIDNRNRKGEQVAVIYDPVDPHLDHTRGIRSLVWDEIARTAMDSCEEKLLKVLKKTKTWTI
ncbi:2'-5'-oligoadenylate synthase 2-like [Amphiura filiformis]|uniref:2'-5'-oligoadenylate synthase 2-like n=1 Tax=Amphiura filiformis TaxID=82378 RepID=UPI003B210B07